MEIESVIISAAITITSLVLLIISLISYYRSENKKLLFVIGVFFIFLIRSILLSLALFIESLSAIASTYTIWILDFFVLILLFMAALKR